MRFDGRQRAVESLRLDERELADTPLCKLGCAGISRQHVRIAVDAQSLII
jgi:hypothetical protein